MFTTFSVAGHDMANALPEKPVPQLRTRRRPVSVACENCRKDRTKCDSQTPCRHCKQKKLACVRLDGATVPGLMQQIQQLVCKVQDLEGRVQHSHSSPTSSLTERADPAWKLCQSGIPDALPFPSGSNSTREHSTPPYLDAPPALLDLSAERFATRLDLIKNSMTEFASIANKCSPIRFALPPGPRYDVSCAAATGLSRKLQDYYVRLYWQRIHRTLPVIDRETFERHYESLWNQTPDGDQSRRNSHMVDIVLALALQLEYSSRPQDLRSQQTAPVPGIDQQENLRHMARKYYETCASTLNEEYESPSLGLLQCYILMVVYLRNDQKHNSAYQVLGSAIRAANILRLHQLPRDEASHEELSIRDQIADFLFCFDVQQFLELGRPCGIPDPSTLRYVPLGGPDSRCFWSYYSELLSIAKGAYTTVRSYTQLTDADASPNTEKLSQIGTLIPQLTNDVTEWATKVPSKFLLDRRFPASPFCTNAPVDMDADLPLWKMRQSLLLELSYHSILMGMLRWYIAPNDPKNEQNLVSSGNSFSSYAERAVEHAITIIDIMHHAHNATEAISGWQDSQIIQWDATLTLLHFLICQPSGSQATKVVGSLAQSQYIFNALGTNFTTAGALIIVSITSTDRTLGHNADYSESNLSPDVATEPSSALGLLDTTFYFNGDLLADESLHALNFPMDLEFMGTEGTQITASQSK